MSSEVYYVNHQGEPKTVGPADEARWGTLYVANSTQHTLVHGQPMGSHALLSRFIQVSLWLHTPQLLCLSCEVAYQARSFCTSQGWKFYLQMLPYTVPFKLLNNAMRFLLFGESGTLFVPNGGHKKGDVLSMQRLLHGWVFEPYLKHTGSMAFRFPQWNVTQPKASPHHGPPCHLNNIGAVAWAFPVAFVYFYSQFFHLQSCGNDCLVNLQLSLDECRVLMALLV